MSSIPKCKADLVSVIQIHSEKLIKECKGVPKERARDVQLDGDISVCDVLAYQIGWGQLLQWWIAEDAKGQVPDLPKTGFRWNELGRLADSFYQAHQQGV